MSNFLVGNNNYAPVWKDHGTSGGVNYTLDGSGTAVGTLVYVGGSIQEPGTDYTISGTAITMTTSVTSGIGVLTCQLYALGTVNVPADASVTTAKISDDQVTLAKMAGLARGTMIYGDASGNPAALAAGSAGEVLTHDGTDIAWGGGGGAWNIIGTVEASTDASITVTGIDGTYATYVVIGSDLKSADNIVQPQLALGDSGGVDTGASDYDYVANHAMASSATGADVTSPTYDRDTAHTHIIMLTNNASGNATNEALNFTAYLDARPATGFPSIFGHVHGQNSNGYGMVSEFHGSRRSQITTDRVSFSYSGGNITSGRMTVWGLAHE